MHRGRGTGRPRVAGAPASAPVPRGAWARPFTGRARAGPSPGRGHRGDLSGAGEADAQPVEVPPTSRGTGVRSRRSAGANVDAAVAEEDDAARRRAPCRQELPVADVELGDMIVPQLGALDHARVSPGTTEHRPGDRGVVVCVQHRVRRPRVSRCSRSWQRAITDGASPVVLVLQRGHLAVEQLGVPRVSQAVQRDRHLLPTAGARLQRAQVRVAQVQRRARGQPDSEVDDHRLQVACDLLAEHGAPDRTAGEWPCSVPRPALTTATPARRAGSSASAGSISRVPGRRRIGSSRRFTSARSRQCRVAVLGVRDGVQAVARDHLVRAAPSRLPEVGFCRFSGSCTSVSSRVSSARVGVPVGGEDRVLRAGLGETTSNHRAPQLSASSGGVGRPGCASHWSGQPAEDLGDRVLDIRHRPGVEAGLDAGGPRGAAHVLLAGHTVLALDVAVAGADRQRRRRGCR